MGTDNLSPIFFMKWTKRPRFFVDVSSICHLHRQHYDARIVHQSVHAYITMPICNISDAAEAAGVGTARPGPPEPPGPGPLGPEPASPEPPRARAEASRPKIIVELTSFASLALGMLCHKKIYQSF
jgi:hypothetical protein